MVYHIMLWHIRLSHSIAYHTMSHYSISCYSISYYRLSYYNLFYYIVAHIISCHIMSCHVTSCGVAWRALLRCAMWLIPWHSLSYHIIPASVTKTLLQRRGQMGENTFRAPNQGLDRSFCRWIAGQWLEQEELLVHRHRYHRI